MSEISGRLGGGRPEAEPDTADVPAAGETSGARWLRRRIAGSVAVVTTKVENGYRGATVSACTFISETPCLILVSLQADSRMVGWIEASGYFGVNLLTWRQQFLADQFAGFAPSASPTFAGIDHVLASTGAPLLTAAVAWADCRLHSTITMGDHRCYLGEVAALGGDGDDSDPMIYYLNRYRRLR
jgi:flavin reductase (DIM6/NTAB) family NADH-FMN oxidoreductase RutF